MLGFTEKMTKVLDGLRAKEIHKAILFRRLLLVRVLFGM